MTVGRKIAPHHENPLDNMLIDLADITNPVFRALHMTPNHITVLSGVFGVACVLAILLEHWVLAGWFYFVSYFFDVADGNYARTYNMVTQFGDLLDHAKDAIVVLGVIWAVWHAESVSWEYKVTFFALQALFYLCMSVHLGCQEHVYEKRRLREADQSDKMVVSESPTLSKFKCLCGHAPPDYLILWTRWVGCGTYTAITSAMLMVAGMNFV